MLCYASTSLEAVYASTSLKLRCRLSLLLLAIPSCTTLHWGGFTLVRYTEIAFRYALGLQLGQHILQHVSKGAVGGWG